MTALLSSFPSAIFPAGIGPDRGAYAQAAAVLDDAVSRARMSGLPIYGPYLFNRIQLDHARGDPAAADEDVEELIAIFGPVGPYWLANPVRLKADALRLRGDLTAAGQVLDDAMVTLHPGAGIWRAHALEGRGRLLRAVGEHQDAEDVHHDALRMLMDAGGYLYLPDTLESLAGLAALASSDEESARLFGAAEAQRDRMRTVRFAIEQHACDADVALVRDRLSDEDFDRAFNEGRAVTLEDAVSYAARGRGARKRSSAGWASLTPTEIEIVKLAAEGLTNPRIAERMFVPRATVKAHLSSIFRKLGVATRAELAMEATRRGLHGEG